MAIITIELFRSDFPVWYFEQFEKGYRKLEMKFSLVDRTLINKAFKIFIMIGDEEYILKQR